MEGLQGLGDMVEGVMAQIREKFKEARQSQGALDSFKAFLAAVDWTEPWIQGLLAAQLVIMVTALLTRNRVWVSGPIFVFAAGIVSCAERLNGILAGRWKEFANQPYFDRQGIFFSAVVSAPLLLTMFILLVNYLVTASTLLVKMKRKELRHRARERARQEKEIVAETPKRRRG